jgi:hypothetical protein
MPNRVTTYKQAFMGVLGLPFDVRWQAFVKELEREGHSEKSVAFAIWRSQEKLLKFKTDARFVSILKNEINKWSWRKGDPRWDEYWKRKREEAKAAQRQREIDARREVERKNRLMKTRYGRRSLGLDGYIYFIQGESGGAIKIGHSMDPVKRLRDLQTSYPDNLILLLMVAGSETDEKALHEQLAASRLKGEWFSPSDEVLSAIETFREQGGSNAQKDT